MEWPRAGEQDHGVGGGEKGIERRTDDHYDLLMDAFVSREHKNRSQIREASPVQENNGHAMLSAQLVHRLPFTATGSDIDSRVKQNDNEDERRLIHCLLSRCKALAAGAQAGEQVLRGHKMGARSREHRGEERTRGNGEQSSGSFLTDDQVSDALADHFHSRSSHSV